MGMTPEGKVKKLITKLLTEYKNRDGLYFAMPVPSGYGKSQLDYVGCWHGRFFTIEAKKPGAKATPRQEDMMREIVTSGGIAFVVDSAEKLAVVQMWLEANR